jgi:hypothetical protein
MNLKSEMQIKDIQKEEIQFLLDKAQIELDKLNGYKYLKKLSDTSYMSSVFNDYENQMNRVDDEIIELFKTTTKYDEQPHQLKQINENEDYIHKNRAIPPFIKEKEDRRKDKEEKRKEIGRTLALESGIRENEYLTLDDSLIKLLALDNENKTSSRKKPLQHKNKSVIPLGIGTKSINPFNPNENNNSNNNNDIIDKE